MNKILLLSSVVAIFLGCTSSWKRFADRQPDFVLFSTNNFSNITDTSVWRIEMDSLPNSHVFSDNDHLVMDTKGGVTVWLNKQLSGNIQIEFNRLVKVGEGLNDRLSDMNVFWMATDARNHSLFTRNGKFEAYDSLRLYYVGVGGNTNTTTRFRRYDGHGNKVLLAEKNDSSHLLKANHLYHIKIVCFNGKVSFWVDGEAYFSFVDDNPLTEGYFGFRSTWSRHIISNLKIVQL